jgi:AcrR family transcriptional regulator
MKIASTDSRAAEVYRTAAAIILVKGYDATSVSDIADALGITKAGLYHYIQGKTALLFEIMKYGFEELERRVLVPSRAIADPEQRLRFIIAAHAGLVLRGDAGVTILVDETRALTPAQKRTITRFKRQYVDALRGTLDELAESGKLREVDTTVAAFSIAGAINWLSRWYKTGGKLSGEAVAANVTELVFHGVIQPGVAAGPVRQAQGRRRQASRRDAGVPTAKRRR